MGIKIYIITNADFINTAGLERSSKDYTTIPDNLRYTYFRDVPLTVSDVTEIKGHPLARREASLRCTLVHEDIKSLLTHENCENDD